MMNDSPGWASPGPSPSDEPEPGGGPDTPPAAAAPNWSEQQPPPGQWSTPGVGLTPPPLPPPHPSPGGWGAQWNTPRQNGPQGWQQEPWGRPPTPKPGVIPLRPLGISEILDGAVSTMRAHWRTVLGISLVVALVTRTATVLVQGFALHNVDTAALSDRNASPADVLNALGRTLGGTGVAVLIAILGTVIASAMLTMVTSRAVLGQPVTADEVWRSSAPRLPRLFGLTLLLPLIATALIVVGALPGVLVALTGPQAPGVVLAVLGVLAGGIVAVWLMVRYSLAPPALMLEKQGVWKSMARSAKLVRGAWWRVLGVQLLATILVSMLAEIVTLPFIALAFTLNGDSFTSLMSGSAHMYGWTFLIVSGIGAVIGSTVTLPISAGVTALLYMDQRIRREGLDIELARAADVPGYAATATHPDSTAAGG